MNKILSQLGKSDYISKTIYKLNVNGEIITSPRDILTKQKKITNISIAHSETNYQRFLENDGSVD